MAPGLENIRVPSNFRCVSGMPRVGIFFGCAPHPGEHAIQCGLAQDAFFPQNSNQCRGGDPGSGCRSGKFFSHEILFRARFVSKHDSGGRGRVNAFPLPK